MSFTSTRARCKELRVQSNSTFNTFASSWTVDSAAIWRFKPIGSEIRRDLKGGERKDEAILPRPGIQLPTIPGPRDESTVGFDVYLTGLGAGATATPAETILTWLLERLMGGTITSSGTTISGTASTTTVLKVLSAADIPLESFLIVPDVVSGVDVWRKVQVTARDTAATPDTVTVYPALTTAPTTNDTQIYGTRSFYFTDDQPDALALLVFGLQTNDQFDMTGAVPSKMSFTKLAPGDNPILSVDLMVNDWRTPSTNVQYAADGFGTAAFADKRPISNGAGRLVVGDVTSDNPTTPSTTGTSYQCEDMKIDIALDTRWDIAIAGAVGRGRSQGALRDNCTVSGSFVVAQDKLWQAWYEAQTDSKYAFYTLQGTPGAHVSFAFRRIRPGSTPKPVAMKGGAEGREVSFRCDEGDAATSAASRAGFFVTLG